MDDSNGSAQRTPVTELLTIKELAKALKISAVTAYRMVEHRELPFFRVRGSLRFAGLDIEAYLLRNRIESKSEWK